MTASCSAQKSAPSYTGCDAEPVVNAPPGNHTSTAFGAAGFGSGVQTFKVRQACSSVGPRKPPGTSPSSGPPIGWGAAGENVVASLVPVHEVTGAGAWNRAAVAYCTPRNTCTV